MQNILHIKTTVNAQAILQASGFRVRGRRADCPHCSGHSKLTVSFTNDGRFYCHRCGRGGHVTGLARKCGISIPIARVRLADIPKEKFRTWLREKMSVLANEERRAYRMKESACAALQSYPDLVPAWDFLAWFFSQKRVWEQFWESASDKLGRFELYKSWRRANAG